MVDFRIGQVFSLLAQTLPFLALRLVVYFAITLLYILGVGVGATVGSLMGGSEEEKAQAILWGALIGFGGISGILYFLREYLLYLVKAGHIAVLVELMETRPIPTGSAQIAYATGKVKERFLAASLLFVLDQIIKAVVRIITRILTAIGSFIPIPGLKGLIKLFMEIVKLSVSFVDGAILAAIYRRREGNVWATARDAVVLYAQNYGKIFRNAIFLALVVWTLTILVFVLVLPAATFLLSFVPGLGGAWTFVIALLMAWSVKAALIEPFAMVALMQVYFRVTEGQQPNPDWVARLERYSKKFRELGRRAAAEGEGGGVAQPGASGTT